MCCSGGNLRTQTSNCEHWPNRLVSDYRALSNGEALLSVAMKRHPTDGQVEVPTGGQIKVRTPPRVGRVGQELLARVVTVKVPSTHRHHLGVPLKSASDRMDIISAYQQVGSYRGAAELCGTTHKTVKRVVERFEAGGPPPPRVERVHNYDPVSELVAERVAKSAGRMSAKRLLPIARAAGYEGSARNFRRLVAEAKALWRIEHHRVRRPAVWSRVSIW